MHIHKHSHSQQQIVENNQNFAKQKWVYAEKRNVVCKISFRSLQQISCDCVFSFWSCSSIEFIHCKYSSLISFLLFCSVLFVCGDFMGVCVCLLLGMKLRSYVCVCVHFNIGNFMLNFREHAHTLTHKGDTHSVVSVCETLTASQTHTHMTHGKWY